MRTGAIYRCGSPHLLDDEQLSRLATVGFQTLIDFRAIREIEHFPAPAQAFGAAHIHLPLPPVASERRDGPLPALLDAYLAIAQLSGPSIAELFRVLSDPTKLPSMLFCAAGKDRTGVAVALLLGALGVDDEDIVGDYAKTGLIDPASLGEIYVERTADAPDGFHDSDPQTMREFIGTIRNDYGSIEEFLSEFGIGAAELKAWERALLVDA